MNSDDDYIEPAQPNGKWQKQQMKNSRHLLNGSVEQLAGDLRQIGEIGVDLAVLNYNRSPISNSIDGMIEVTRQLDKLVK